MRQGMRLAPVVLSLLMGCGRDPASMTPEASPTPDNDPNPHLNKSLLSHLELTVLASGVQAAHDEPTGEAGALSGSGNWGYTSPGGRRIALTGISTGLSIVDVTDPRRARNLGLITGPDSQWREVKTYRSYAYVTTEARWGLDIVDLRDPDHPRRVQTWSKTFASAHTLWIDEARGLLFANGTRSATGVQTGMRVLSIEPNPEDPQEVGSFQPFYVHDAYTRGSVLYASAIYDGFLALLDVSNAGNAREIARFFTGGRLTHNSWPSHDGRYLFTTDERAGRPLEAWDIRDSRAPRKVAEYIAEPGTIPHNVVVDGDRLLVAHYTEGVHLLDIRDPEQPKLLGYYDTYPGSGGFFAGVWGAYVFPGSSVILASDMQGGLFVLNYNGR